MAKNDKLLFIIPAYNEEENILKVVNTINNYKKKSQQKYDLIVINDGSSDNTERILTENRIPHIRLIHNLGIGGAVQTGYRYALENDYDIAIQYDGDGQHDIQYAEKIIAPILNGEADMVIGSRFIDKNSNSFKSSFVRRIGIKLISFVIKFKTNKMIYDTTSGFRAINKKVMETFVDDYPIEYPEPISTVHALQKNYKVKEVPVEMHERKGGKSSITSWKSIYYMINVILSILIVERKCNK